MGPRMNPSLRVKFLQSAGRGESNSLLEAQVLVEDWRIEYNTLRPHSALGYLTPTDYAKTWTTIQPALS